jgi:catechol 2,3-dioxygenase-like lactoylglutathione lyase family enzyme
MASVYDSADYMKEHTMTIELAHITFDCADPQAEARFWSGALDTPVDDGGSDFFATIDDRVGERPSWFFIKVPEGKTVKNRVHVDLKSDRREAAVARLIGLGAKRLSDHDEWGAVWTVMADPEGNEFCVG